MGLDLRYAEGQSPLDEDEKEGLKIRTISTRGELDEFEQANIEMAVKWSLSRKIPLEKMLSIAFIKELHKRMFSEVWKWAGTFRQSNKNIGVDKFFIEQELKKLVDDCKYWINHQTWSNDEIAIRYKHRLVKIHPFPNGNGRHSRLSADILVSHILERPVFTWGGAQLNNPGDIRSEYLNAIYDADQGNIRPLINFARS